MLLTTAATVTAPHPLLRMDDPPNDDKWPVTDRVPMVADHPELAVLCDRAQQTAERQISRAVLVLDQAARLGDLECQDCLTRLRTMFDRASTEAQAARDLAASGDVLGSLRALTRLDLPVPEDGVPGQADVSQLRAQTNSLARLALRHRAAIETFQLTRAREKA